MSVSSIGSTNSTTALQQLFTKNTANGAVPDQDGDNDGSGVKAAGKGGKFASAIQQALAQFGIGGSDTSAGTVSASSTASGSADTATSTTQDPQQALQAFAHSLFAAIHAQSAASSGSSTGTQSGTQATGGLDAVAATSGEGKGHHHHGGGGAGKLESGLQSLIQQLSSGASTSSAATSETSSASTSTSSASNDLQTSFNNLLTADGATGSSTTLSSFLQALSQKLEGAPSTGNVVNTKV